MLADTIRHTQSLGRNNAAVSIKVKFCLFVWLCVCLALWSY